MQKIGLKYLKVICVSKVPKTASLAKLQFVIQALLKIVIATAEKQSDFQLKLRRIL